MPTIEVEINFVESMSGVRATDGLIALAILMLPTFNRAAYETPQTDSTTLRIAVGQTIHPDEANRTVEVEGTVTIAPQQFYRVKQ